MADDTFLYFAYGSNLLKERLQLKNPSATIHCVARLKDYRLAFGNYQGRPSDRWHGGVATIVQSPGDEVWGVVWRMSVRDLKSLDRQENVKFGTYSPVEVSVSTKEDEMNCRTYIMNNCVYAPPSPQYLKVTLFTVESAEEQIPHKTIPVNQMPVIRTVVIVLGAEQNGLPSEYQLKLKAIETNNYNGPLELMSEVEEAMRRGEEKYQ